MVSSNWKITYDPDGAADVLVDFGDDIADELSLSWGQAVDNVPRTAAAGMDYFGRGQVSIPFRFSVRRDHDTDADMRNWILALLADLPVLEKKPLRIEVKCGKEYQFDVAVIQSVNPAPIIVPDGAETWTEYNFLCGPLKEIEDEEEEEP
jgi:hypothetical protein